jgi:hypothetical protein
MNLIVCSNCNTHVLPNPDGTCPNCQAVIPQGESAVSIRPVEPSRNPVAVEEFTYKKYWKVMLLIQAGVWVLFAFLMLAVGFFFVFPSGGVVRFGGMGWLFFIMGPVGAIVGFLQYRKATDYSVKLSENTIRVGNVRAKWAEIVKLESHMTDKDRANQTAGIQLTTRRGSSLFISALTENLPYIMKYIEDHAKNLKGPVLPVE